MAAAMSVVYVLTTPIHEDGGDDPTMKQQIVESRKELWNSLEAKYMAKDASSVFVSNFTNYKITDSRPVMEQHNELLGILGRFTKHKMNMDEAIQVSCIIDKLSPSWKYFKHTLKHKKEELTLVELGSHLPIEESLRAQDSDKPKGNNVVGLQNLISSGILNKLNIVNNIGKLAFMSTFKLNDSIICCLCDLHVIPSLGNKKYFVTFIDDASMFCYVCLLHSKDEALNKFKVFETEVELQKGSWMKRFRTDRGGEYMDTLYFQSVGIIHETTAPYTPQQNVVPEEVTEEVVQQPEPELRKSKRNRTPKNFGLEFQLYLIEGTRDEVSDQYFYCFNVKDGPKTFDEAIKSQDVAFWKEAINDEMDSIMGNNTWVLADLPLGCKPLGCKMDLQKKTKVARISTIRLLIAMASIHNLIIYQMDVKTAFLNGDLDEEVYMNQPDGSN
ncbi:zinc finger, CCHC-type containing protein [Tanacetum coccineum]